MTEEEAAALETIGHRDILDRNLILNIVKAERFSLTALEGEEGIRESSLNRSSEGVQAPLKGKTVEHLPKGEQIMPSVSFDATAIGERILYALTSKSAGYMSVSRLANTTGLSVEQVRAFATANPNRVRKSLMRASNGEEVYMLNTSLSGLSDSWNAFRHFNSKKF